MSKQFAKLKVYELGAGIAFHKTTESVPFLVLPKGQATMQPWGPSGFVFQNLITGDVIAYVDTYDDILNASDATYGVDQLAVMTAIAAFFFELGGGGSGDGFTEVEITITPNTTTYSDGRPPLANGHSTLGTVPISVLPAAGAGTYYKHDGALEYAYDTTDFTLNDIMAIINLDTYTGAYLGPSLIELTADKVYTFNSEVPQYKDAFQDPLINTGFNLNQELVFTTWNGTNPSSGDGTFKIKLRYKIVTFG